MKLEGHDEEDEENDKNYYEIEREDLRSILFSSKNPTKGNSNVKKKIHSYHTTKNNIKKPLAYFKVCDFCRKKENICDCLQLLRGKTVQQTDQISTIPQKKTYFENLIYLQYKPKPPSFIDVKENLQKTQCYSLYQ